MRIICILRVKIYKIYNVERYIKLQRSVVVEKSFALAVTRKLLSCDELSNTDKLLMKQVALLLAIFSKSILTQ